ncbi:MAG: hypothetical protein ACI8SA_000983 [Dokdonia sp.]|jgi:hypothetical protein
MMEFFANTIGRWLLGRKWMRLERNSVALNLSAMNSAVVIFDIGTESDYQLVIELVKVLKLEGVNAILVLGYCEEKVSPTYLDASIVRVLTKSEIRFMGFPTEEYSKRILNDSFDLLIDFTDKDKMPTEYFLTLIDAKTKVGRDNSVHQKIFDLLINQKGSDKKEYLKSVIHFLKMINKG